MLWVLDHLPIGVKAIVVCPVGLVAILISLTTASAPSWHVWWPATYLFGRLTLVNAYLVYTIRRLYIIHLHIILFVVVLFSIFINLSARPLLHLLVFDIFIFLLIIR